jgi:hypothetical protein
MATTRKRHTHIAGAAAIVVLLAAWQAAATMLGESKLAMRRARRPANVGGRRPAVRDGSWRGALPGSLFLVKSPGTAC